jgi:hypothetical protein
MRRAHVIGEGIIHVLQDDPMSFTRTSAASLALVGAFVFTFANAAELPDNVLARNQWTELTRADYDAALARIPENMRIPFATSPKRVQIMLNNLLVDKTLAAQARAHGIPAPMSVSPDSDADVTKALAEAELARIEKDAGAEFDAKKNEFEAKAHEMYLVDRESYRVPEKVRLSDIAITIKDRGDEAALARALEARARVVAGVDFGVVAREYSDDATTREKGGALPLVTEKELTPAFAAGVFAQPDGEISQPIKGPSAYHIVRIEERKPSYIRPFEEVRETIVQTLRQQYVAKARQARIDAIYQNPDLLVNQAAVDALVQRIDPKLLERSSSGDAADPSSSLQPQSKSN